MNSKNIPSSWKPPLQPKLPYENEQSVNCCGDRVTFVLFLNHKAASSAATEPNAQQSPQVRWSRTGLLKPALTQS